MNEKEGVDDLMSELATEHYLGEVQSICVVTIDKMGEPQLRMSLNRKFIYPLIVGMDLMKQNLMKDIIENAASTPKKRDI